MMHLKSTFTRCIVTPCIPTAKIQHYIYKNYENFQRGLFLHRFLKCSKNDFRLDLLIKEIIFMMEKIKC